jgi:DNA-binding transcriptional MerR regulator
MPEQLDLFSNETEQDQQNPVEKASAMLLERRLKPPAVIMQSHAPDIIAPRSRENKSENIDIPVENKLENEKEQLPTIPDESSKAESLAIVDERPEPVIEAGIAKDPVKESLIIPDIDTDQVKESLIIPDIDITSAMVLDISEPIAIIAVKPAEEEKPKTTRGRKSINEMSMEADLPQVPEDEKLFSKQYYGIGEVAIMFQVNASLLRYWETEFDVLKPKKNGKGDRFFRPEDIKNLQIIHHLLRQKKFTIQGAKDYLKNNKQSKEKFEMVKQLQQLRAFLLEMKAGL